MCTNVFSNPKKVEWPPGVKRTPNQTLIGIIPWWTTCRSEMCSSFLRSTKKNCFFCLKRQKKQNDFQSKKFVKFVNEALNSTYSVKKLGEFREVVPPASVHHLNRQENFAEYKSHTNEYISLMNRHENVRHLKNWIKLNFQKKSTNYKMLKRKFEKHSFKKKNRSDRSHHSYVESFCSMTEYITRVACRSVEGFLQVLNRNLPW